MKMMIKIQALIQNNRIRCEPFECFHNRITQHSYAIIFSPVVNTDKNAEVLIPLLFDPDLPKQIAQFICNEEDKAVIEDFITERHINREKCEILYEPNDEITFELEISQTEDENSEDLERLLKGIGLPAPQDLDDAIKKIDRKLVGLVWQEFISEIGQNTFDINKTGIANGFIKKLLSNHIALTSILVEDIVEVPSSIKAHLSSEDISLLKSFGSLIQALGKSNVIKQDVVNSLGDIVKCAQCTKELYLAIMSHNTILKLFSRDDRQEIHNNVVLRHTNFFDARDIKSSANYYYYRKEFADAATLFQILEENHSNEFENNTDLAETLNSLGCCFVELLEFEKAYLAFDRAIKIDNNYAPVYNNLAYTLMIESETLSNKQSRKKKLQEALANINDAIPLNPNEISYISNRAYIEYELGNYTRVLRDLDRARLLSTKYEDYSTILKLSIDARIRLDINASNGQHIAFNDLFDDLMLIYENEPTHSKYFEALNVYNKTKDNENAENLKELTNALVLLEFYVSELLTAIAIHNPRQEIYYYTSMNSLQRVLCDENEQIRYRLPIFNVNHMNDPREGKELEKALLQRVGKSPMIQELFNQQPNATPNRKRLESEFVFLKSFTKNVDALPMWVHYADSGKGCCVRVSRNFFTNFNSDLSGEEKTLKTDPFDNEYRLYAILYVKDGRLVNTVSNDVKELYEKVISLFSSVSGAYQKMSEMTQGLVLQAIRVITRKLKYLIKSSDYTYEQEMRIVLWRPLSDLKRDDIDIRMTPSSEKYPIPKVYVYTTKSLPIEEIIFGPKVVETDDIVPFFTKKLLDLHNYATEKVLITKSEIEYR